MVEKLRKSFLFLRYLIFIYLFIYLFVYLFTNLLKVDNDKKDTVYKNTNQLS